MAIIAMNAPGVKALIFASQLAALIWGKNQKASQVTRVLCEIARHWFLWQLQPCLVQP
jgi:hypothetical protein